MNYKYTVLYGDTRTENIITFVSRKYHFFDVLDDCGYKATHWNLCNKPCYIEYNDNNLPTGRYFKVISFTRTNEKESDEVIFF